LAVAGMNTNIPPITWEPPPPPPPTNWLHLWVVLFSVGIFIGCIYYFFLYSGGRSQRPIKKSCSVSQAPVSGPRHSGFLSWLWPRDAFIPRASLVLLAIENLILLAGVLYLDWQILAIVIVFAIETYVGFVFFWVYVSRDVIRSKPSSWSPVIGYSLPFVIFGILSMGFFMVAFYGLSNRPQETAAAVSPLFIILCTGIAASQLLNGFSDLKRRTFGDDPVEDVIPFIRFFVFIFGGMAVKAEGVYTGSLVALIVFKTVLDARYYLRKPIQPNSMPST
jgi:hypothetical protein